MRHLRASPSVHQVIALLNRKQCGSISTRRAGLAISLDKIYTSSTQTSLRLQRAHRQRAALAITRATASSGRSPEPPPVSPHSRDSDHAHEPNQPRKFIPCERRSVATTGSISLTVFPAVPISRFQLPASHSVSFDGHGNRVWRAVQELLDPSAPAARQGGRRPVRPGNRTNVRTGGDTCPVRFRCDAEGHFGRMCRFCPISPAMLTICDTPVDGWSHPSMVSTSAPAPTSHKKEITGYGSGSTASSTATSPNRTPSTQNRRRRRRAHHPTPTAFRSACSPPGESHPRH